MNRDQELRETLRRWEVNSGPSPRFEDQVWRRIAQAEEANVRWPVVPWLSGLLRRPAWAMSYCALVLVLGAGIGYAQANRANESARLQYQTQYLQSVNPYAAASSAL